MRGVQRKLVEVCARRCVTKPKPTVPQAYIPYVPAKWNGMLVLAEAQNHGDAEYLWWLKGLTVDERVRRLYLRERIGIQPWDDGSLKLAVEAAFGAPADRCAVSNAVLWSTVGPRGEHHSPDLAHIARSQKVWWRMLPVLKPNVILATGKIAADMMRPLVAELPTPCKLVCLRLPSPSNLSRISGMFDTEDLLTRYPEVGRAATRHPEWLEGRYRKNKIFFACHAVSVEREG